MVIKLTVQVKKDKPLVQDDPGNTCFAGTQFQGQQKDLEHSLPLLIVKGLLQNSQFYSDIAKNVYLEYHPVDCLLCSDRFYAPLLSSK